MPGTARGGNCAAEPTPPPGPEAPAEACPCPSPRDPVHQEPRGGGAVYSVPRAAATKRHRLCGFNNRDSPSHSCGGWKSKAKGSAGLVPSEAVGENPRQASLPAGGGLLVDLWGPWLMLDHPDLCLHLHRLFPPPHVQMSPFHTHTSHIGVEAQPRRA